MSTITITPSLPRPIQLESLPTALHQKIGSFLTIKETGRLAAVSSFYRLHQITFLALPLRITPTRAEVYELVKSLETGRYTSCALKLDFSLYPDLQDDQLLLIARFCPDLRELNLSHCKLITDRGVIAICENCRFLESLNILGTDVTDSACEIIGNRCAQLKRLNASYCEKTTDAGLRLLAGCSRLIDLSLRGSAVSDESLLLLGKKAQHIRSLDLTACFALTARGLVEASPFFPALIDLTLDIEEISPETLIALVTNLPQLSRLGIRSGDEVTDDIIAKMIEVRPTITHLSLSSSAITDKALTALSRSTFQGIEAGYGPSFSEASLEEFISTCAHLRHFTLAHSVSQKTCALLATRPQLEHLDISCRDLADADLIPLIKNCPRLRVLILTSADLLTDEFLITLAKHAPYLQELRLFDCTSLTANGIRELIQGCSQLTCLDLSGSTIDDKALLALGEQHPALEELLLSRCKKISSRATGALFKNLPHLRKLDIGFCEQMDDAVITGLLEHGHRIIDVHIVDRTTHPHSCTRAGLDSLYREKPWLRPSVDLELMLTDAAAIGALFGEPLP